MGFSVQDFLALQRVLYRMKHKKHLTILPWSSFLLKFKYSIPVISSDCDYFTTKLHKSAEFPRRANCGCHFVAFLQPYPLPDEKSFCLLEDSGSGYGHTSNTKGGVWVGWVGECVIISFCLSNAFRNSFLGQIPGQVSLIESYNLSAIICHKEVLLKFYWPGNLCQKTSHQIFFSWS